MRYVILGLVFALALAVGSAGGTVETGSVSESQVAMGPHMEPNGLSLAIGPQMEPNGLSLAIGPQMEPNGLRLAIGPHAEPHGLLSA